MVAATHWFPGGGGVRLRGILERPSGSGPFPLIVLVSGLSAVTKPIGRSRFSNSANARGFAVFRFDWAGHGRSRGSFFNFTPSQAIADVAAATRFARQLPTVDRRRVFVSGASIGGLATVYLATRPPAGLKAITLVAPAVDAPLSRRAHWGPLALALWRLRGYHTYYNGQRLGYGFHLDSFVRRGVPIAARIAVPTLIVHGDQDESVPLALSRTLFNRIRTRKRLVVVPGAGHSFARGVRARHLINCTLTWFARFL